MVQSSKKVNQIAAILFVGINIAMAGYHASLIKKGKYIKHGWWGLLYFILAGAAAYFNHSWILAVDSLFIRKVFFDLSLNLWRGKPLFYVSSSTTSIIDKFHNKVFDNRSEVYMTLYAGIAVILTIIA